MGINKKEVYPHGDKWDKSRIKMRKKYSFLRVIFEIKTIDIE